MSASSIRKKYANPWEGVQERAAQGGYRDILVRCGKHGQLRGPILGVSIQGEDVIISVGWMAERNTGEGWRAYPSLRAYSDFTVNPETRGVELRLLATTACKAVDHGSIEFDLDGVGAVKLFDRDCPSHGFEPRDVQGLSLGHIKKWWAHTFDLPLGSNWATIGRKAHRLHAAGFIRDEHLAHVEEAISRHMQHH